MLSIYLHDHETMASKSSRESSVIGIPKKMTPSGEWSAMNAEYVKFFPHHLPARSAFGCNGLALGARVEIECIALRT